jgi:hypothetical protein
MLWLLWAANPELFHCITGDGSLVMRHEHRVCALVSQRELGQTLSSSDGVLHGAPEAFPGVEHVSTMGQ